MKAPENIYTERLSLRKITLADAATIFGLYGQDLDVTRFMTWRPHESQATTEDFIRFCLDNWDKGTGYALIIERQADGQLLGMIEPRPKGHQVEVGYVLGQPYWGKGYMTEALLAVIQWTWEQPEIYRFWAVCDVENRGSRRVMEKAGLEQEGILRRSVLHPNISDVPRDCYVYSVVR